MKVSLILLLGGKGARFGSNLPKQYLPLGDKPIFMHSLELFVSIKEIEEIVIVRDPSYEEFFTLKNPKISYALPGKRRQDSVYHAMKALKYRDLLLIHDGARPFIKKEDVLKIIEDGKKYHAAALGVAVTSTIKEANKEHMVTRTLERDALFSMQTPQAITYEILFKGYDLADKKHLTLTDDVSFAELIKRPVKITHGDPSNFKITTPFDYELAKLLYDTAL